MTLEAQRVVVVGGAGFVGSNLVRRLLDTTSAEIVVVDNLLSSERTAIPDDDRIEFVEASINDVVDDLGLEFDYLFHLATYHGNQSSMARPLADHEHNLLPTLRISEAFSKSQRLKKLVYASAGCTVAEKTYDAPDATQEDSPISPYLDSPYQISKVVGEFYLNYYWKSSGLPAVKARFQNVYGPGEVLGAGRWRGTPATIWRNVTPTFVYRAIKGMPLILHNNGDVTRDFIYVDDIVTGLMLCAERGEDGGVYNLASGVETTIRGLAETIVSRVGGDAKFELMPGRDWDHSGRRFGSPEKAQRELGFSASTKLADGIDRTVQWTLDNLDRIESLMASHEGRVDELEKAASR